MDANQDKNTLSTSLTARGGAAGLYGLMKLLRNNKPVQKTAGEENEPTPELHTTAPDQKIRPRAEVIIYNKEGIWGIMKDGYLMLPGGGIPEGERPQEAAIREALEEADRVCYNIEARDTISTIYDPDVFKYKDWDGEKTYFFIAMDGGPGGMNHKDKEQFEVIPYDEAIMYLNDLMNENKQEWAFFNNMRRMRLIQEAERLTDTTEGMTPHKYASHIVAMTKVAMHMQKQSFLSASAIHPKNRVFQPVRNAFAGMYKNMRKTPLGSDVARLLYDNVEILPHQLTQPIPLYPTNSINLAYALIGGRNRSAKLRTAKHMIGTTYKGLKKYAPTITQNPLKGISIPSRPNMINPIGSMY